jgi:hypothetical protein
MSELGAAPQACAEPAIGVLTDRLRNAIRREAYEDVLGLLPEYNRRFEQALQAASGDLAETRRVAAEARELFDWARATVAASRAHTEASLGKMNAASRYKTLNGPSPRRWQVEG